MSVADKGAKKDDIDWYDERASCPEEDCAFVLGPGDKRGVKGNCTPFTPDEARAVLEGTHNLYVIGRVEYEDAFGEARRTRFCHIYSGLDLGKDGGVYGHYGNSYT